MFFRALHTISTQRYRLPVRRYILDLFNIELDHEVVLSLHDYAKSLRAPSSHAPRRSLIEPLLGRLGRKRSATESDGDESDLDDPAPSVGVKVKEQRLEPLSKVVGFAI
jgi:rapamycin-insensitive companion of mTOR